MSYLVEEKYSALLINVFFVGIKIYGLLFLNWSGLYILYLYLIELCFLFGYTIFRFRQLIKLIDHELWKKYSILRMKNYQLRQAMIALIISRSVTLLWYLFLIGIMAVPYERNERGVASFANFFENLIITDVLFIISVIFIASYYLKKIISRPDTSLKGILSFSFNLDPLDPRFIIPNFALLSIPVVLALYFWLHNDTIPRSNLYLFALWLLFARVVTDIYTSHRMAIELKARGL